MKSILQLSEEEFFQWLETQFERREFLYRRRFEREKVREVLYEILFYEQRLSVEEIEQFFIPFGQAGYLSARQKFEIMLFILEKEYGKSFMFLEGRDKFYIITSEDVEEAYYTWALEGMMYLSEEEKKEFFVRSLVDKLGLGIIEVLKRISPDGILLGAFCPEENRKDELEERVAVYFGGIVVHMPFLKIDSREEMLRIIKYALAMEKKGELTMMEPMLDFVRDDGTCITAIRPPAGKDWGIRIMYGAAGKERITGWNE